MLIVVILVIKRVRDRKKNSEFIFSSCHVVIIFLY